MRVIGLTTYGHVEETLRVLNSLASCDGIKDYVVIVSQDPHSDAGITKTLADMVKAQTFTEVRLHVQPQRLGNFGNGDFLCREAFKLAEFAVFLNDDNPLAADALKYFEHCDMVYQDNLQVFSVTAYNRLPSVPAEADWHKVNRRCWYHPWGTGLWRDKWNAVAGAKGFQGYLNDTPICEWMVREKIEEVFPVFARCQNIGLQTTVQDTSRFTPAWYAENHLLKYWAGQVNMPAGEFHE